ncbi:hypothetical protein ELE36_10050 [Pseudolysobacter antarcticus]|uniref:Uncharacterized protein n=1 Tax=Pseudolysobacter antarcticus TaxID=2511995 RepID=A0A411HJW8_9GAMM|nr:hypothetical protein [Pseudolysobacter antarcticus]QBB70677.1 hypothetical protein ELE36_10050 [Pseudolysobacter antarcticus]
MQLRILTTIVASLVVIAAMGRTLYTTDFRTPAISNNASDTRMPLATSGAILGLKDGLVEAHADGLTGTVRVKRLQMADASTLLAKVCEVMPNHLSWIKSVRVYAPDTADMTNPATTAELSQSCQ